MHWCWEYYQGFRDVSSSYPFFVLLLIAILIVNASSFPALKLIFITFYTRLVRVYLPSPRAIQDLNKEVINYHVHQMLTTRFRNYKLTTTFTIQPKCCPIVNCFKGHGKVYLCVFGSLVHGYNCRWEKVYELNYKSKYILIRITHFACLGLLYICDYEHQ